MSSDFLWNTAGIYERTTNPQVGVRSPWARQLNQGVSRQGQPPFRFCVRVCVWISSHFFKALMASRSAPRWVQVNLSGAPVLMAKDPLNRSDVDVGSIQKGGPLVPQGMETEIPDARLLA